MISQFESSMGESEKLYRQKQKSVFDIDIRTEGRSALPNSIIFEAVIALSKEKKIIAQLNDKKKQLE
jgi:hypothetical protein